MPKNKTMRHRHNDSVKCVDATFAGLFGWYKRMFEELGWMILAKNYGMMDKVATYKNSIMRLKCAIEKKMVDIKDSDKKKDLKIMHKNVCMLWEHVMIDF